MDYNIREQIDIWTKKLAYYKSKELSLRQRIAEAEKQRMYVDSYPVGSVYIDRFYRYLNSLYSQLAHLPAKIRHCNDNISTLKCEL